MKTACVKCGKSYRHETYDPPRQYIGGFYGYNVINTIPDESIEVAYDDKGRPYPKVVERVLPALLIKEDWIKDCKCQEYEDDEYCSECPHCNPEE